MKVKQISIFIENKSGRLAEVARILREKMSISGLFHWQTPRTSAFFVFLLTTPMSLWRP